MTKNIKDLQNTKLNRIFLSGVVVLPGDVMTIDLYKASSFVSDKDMIQDITSNNYESVLDSHKDNGYAIILYPTVSGSNENDLFGVGTLVQLDLKESNLTTNKITGEQQINIKLTAIAPIFDHSVNGLSFLSVINSAWDKRSVEIANLTSNGISFEKTLRKLATALASDEDLPVETGMNVLEIENSYYANKLLKKPTGENPLDFFNVISEIAHTSSEKKVYFKPKRTSMSEGESQKFVVLAIAKILKLTDENKHMLLSTNCSTEQITMMQEFVDPKNKKELDEAKSSQDDLGDRFTDEELKMMKELPDLSYRDADPYDFDDSDDFDDFEATVRKAELSDEDREFLEAEEEEYEFNQDLDYKVNKDLMSINKKSFLYHKLGVIKKELGIDSDGKLESLQESYSKKEYPTHVAARIEKELARAEGLQPGASEVGVSIDYLELLIEMPWLTSKEESINIPEARSILNDSHFGMEDVKERIIEHLAVQKQTKGMTSPILCLVGPPGVGKTSIAHSIAKASHREFVKMSLGGVSDEHEIRGHRKTYVGAMPGKIVKAIQSVGVNNPLFLLDEIDKLSFDSQGDPSSALLEVLDPSQNDRFSDHFLEEEFDLSNVMFIATANYVDDIPDALFDRMEVLELSSYTEPEKLQIASKHLLPKVLKEVGLTENLLSVDPEAISTIIESYTMESGVRQLERELQSVARKSLLEYLQEVDTNPSYKVDIKSNDIEKYLGKKKRKYNMIDEENQVGLVSGLGYSPYGGSILPIEASLVPGDGRIHLTGRLGEVMSESAELAYAYVRGKSKELGFDIDILEDNDIHIHVPEGAVPKDGPSAGIALATVLSSLISNRPVHADLAMTGEITLRGRVLEIGGLKEKSIAAHRAGVKKIIIPYGNKSDLDEMPDIVLKEVKFIPVKFFHEVLAEALCDKDE